MTTSSRQLRSAAASPFHRSALRIGALATFAVLLVAPVHAREYVAYAGAYPARVKTVETASRVVMEVPVWTGFQRDFKITLADIAVPRSTGGPRCESELAERARKFTETFLAQAGRVEARDLRMHDSADENAKAGVFTDAGSLADALKSQGLARGSDIGADVPWCGAK